MPFFTPRSRLFSRNTVRSPGAKQRLPSLVWNVLSALLAAPRPMAVLQLEADCLIEGPHIDPTMRHRNASAVRTLITIGKVVPNDLAARVFPGPAEPNIAMLMISGPALGRPVRCEGNRRLPLPVHPLPAYLRKLRLADLLGNGAERGGAPGPTSNGFWTSSSQLPVITASMRSECSAVERRARHPLENIQCAMAQMFGRH